jgi:hypothetical protein
MAINKGKAIKIFVAALTCIGSVVQLPAQREDTKDEEVLRQVRLGSPDDMLQAGRRDLKAAVPLLQRYTRSKDIYKANSAQMALAKMGDSKLQQDMYCRLVTDSYWSGLDVVEQRLPYVGGWFAFNLLNEIAESRLAADLPLKPSDVSVRPLSTVALIVLSKMTEVQTRSGDGKLTLEQWKSYFQAHQEQLKTLVPKADEVVYSPDACGKTLRGKPKSTKKK